MEIGFADQSIPDPTRAELEDVLRGIAIDNVDRITILRRIPGGRSGADVLDVELERPPTGRIERRVIKVDALPAITEEWLAYENNLASRRNTLITPVETVSRRVLESEPTPNPDRAAIVYHHAADYAATPNAATHTLEDLVRAALSGTTPVDEVVGLLDTLLRRITAAFYSDAKIAETKRTLLSTNPSLGPDITLEVDRSAGPRLIKYQDPVPGVLPKLRRYQRDILAASTGAPDCRINIDGTVYLRELSPGKLSDDGTLTATWGDITLRIQPAKPAAENLRLADLCTQHSFDIIGKTIALRAHDHWQRIERLWPTVKSGSAGVGAGDTRVDHPFGRLHTLLTEDVSGRPTALTHGDLNPRNVLHLGGQIFLIDFAQTAPGRPLLSDFAWLETCLMRDVIAPRLDWPTLVLLQRTLATAARLADLLPNPQSLSHLLGDNPTAQAAFAILWPIRHHAHQAYPATARQPWWRDYLTHLTLAGCRTLKWPDSNQTEATTQAVVASCGVAAEWLHGPNPYRNWPVSDGVPLIKSVVPELRTDHPASADALAEFVSAADTLRGRHNDLWDVLETARAVITTATYADAARRTLVDLHDDHELFISLDAYIALEGQLTDAQLTDDEQAESARSSRRRRAPRPGPPVTGVQYGFGRRTLEGDPADQDDVMRLVTARSRVVVLGGAGSGKSTVARELQFQLATSVNEPNNGDLRPLMPVLVRASDVAQAVEKLGPDAPLGDVLRAAAPIPISDAMLTLGGVHLAVDAFNELTPEPKAVVAQWVLRISAAFRHTPVLVCHRTFEYEPDLLPYPTVVLRPVTAGQARRYIADMLRIRGMDDAANRSARLAQMLLDNPEQQQVQDLAKTPLFLWMIVKRYVETAALPSNIGALFADFAQWYLQERHHERVGEHVPVPRVPYATKVQVLETLGRHLVEHGNVTEIKESEALSTLAVKDPAGVLNEIVGSEMLHRHAGSLRFMHQSFQEYFAARVFAREADDELLLRDRAMIWAWREPLRIMLGFSGDNPELTERLIQIALRADPRFTSKLLRASENPPRTAVERFIAAQRQTLTGPGAGVHAWQIAAEALADHGTPEACAVLHEVSTGDHPLAARLAAFAALVSQSRDSTGDAELAATVAALLPDSSPVALREAAIHAVGAKRLLARTLDIGDLIDEHEPWPVVKAAAEALETLGVSLSDKRRQHYLRACETRLLAVEDELRHSNTPSWDVQGELMTERQELLERFVSPARLDLLLARRFSFGLAQNWEWGDWLGWSDEEAPPDLPATVRHLLVEDASTDELLAAFADPASDEMTVVAAAHRLIEDAYLEDGTTVAAALLPLVDRSSSPTRLLALAAALTDTGIQVDDELPRVEALIRGILDQFREELVEPLVALIEALNPHRITKIVLANVAGDILSEDHYELTIRWPFYEMWSTANPTDEDLSTLLVGDEDQVWAGISFLAAYARVVSAAPPLEVSLTEPASAAFSSYWRSSPTIQQDRAGSFLLACVTAGAFSFIDELVSLMRDPAPEMTEPWQYATIDYSAAEIVNLSLLLSSLGYLGRLAYDHRDIGAAQRAYDAVRQFDPTGEHPSVGRGKLIGLGYLGDWIPLLSALDTDDPLLHGAAANTIRLWVPGPFTPSGYGEPEEVANWIAAELRRPYAQVTPGRRSTLSAIKEQLEMQLGRYVVPE